MRMTKRLKRTLTRSRILPMKRDIHKLSEWVEKTVRAGVADERALRDLKLSQKAVTPLERPTAEASKAS